MTAVRRFRCIDVEPEKHELISVLSAIELLRELGIEPTTQKVSNLLEMETWRASQCVETLIRTGRIEQSDGGFLTPTKRNNRGDQR